MAVKMKNAFALLCVAALFAIGDAQKKQDCETGPAPPSDLEIFLWVNSGVNRRFSGKGEAALERLRANFLCQDATISFSFADFSAVVPILETDVGTACSIPLASSCNLLSSCPAERERQGRRLTQCMPLFGCAFSVALAIRTKDPDGGRVVPCPDSRAPIRPATAVGICFQGLCSIFDGSSSHFVLGALAYRACPKVYVSSIVDGWTPLHWMSNIAGNSRSTPEFETAVEALIENGADLEARDAQGFTPLHLASEMYSQEVLKPLMSAGANLEAKDNFGNTPLAVASYFGKDFIVKQLLKAGANPNVRYIEAPGSTNPGGGNFKTPLHFVALYGMGPLKELIEAGADVNAMDSDGNTPLDFAIEFKRVRTISVLREARRQAERKSSAQNPGL